MIKTIIQFFLILTQGRRPSSYYQLLLKGKDCSLTLTKKGFTLIELLVSIGIFAIVLAGSWASYLNFQRSHSLNNYSTQILSTIYQAQNQAMSRMCTQNCDSAESGENFGVYLDTTNHQVTFYRGIVYNSSDNYNTELKLPDNLTLATDLPTESNLVFQKISGEVRNFDANHHSFTLRELNSGEQKNFEINRLGVVDIN